MSTTTQQQQPVSSSPRLTYTRDFLLKFQHITKSDNSLSEVLKPFLTPQPRKTVPFGSSTRRPVSSTVEKSKDFHVALDYNEAMAASPTPVMPNGAKWRGENSKSLLTGLLQGQSDPANPGHTGKKFDARRALTNANQSNSNSNANNINQRSPLSDLSKGRGLNGQAAAFSPRATQALPKITVTPLSPLQAQGANKENVVRSNGRFDSPVSDLSKSWRSSPSTTPSKLKEVGSTEKKAWKIPTNENMSGPASPIAAHLFSATPLCMSPEATRRTVKMSLVTPSSPSTPVSSESAVKSPKTGSPKIIDQHQLEQRQKQVDYGHQTLGYLRYRLLVPKDKRSREDPRTPKKSQACSKRSWDGQVKKWRRDLHKWDPEDSAAFVAWLESDFVIKIIENNIGSELIELIRQIKERAAKFQNSPGPSPSADGTSPTLSPTLSPTMLSPAVDRCCETAADLDDEKVARKLVF